MLLAIDVGNTNSVFALSLDDKDIGEWRISTQTHRTADEYGIWLVQLLRQNGLDIKEIKGSIISTVVPDAEFSLRMMCKNYCNVDPFVVRADNLPLDLVIEVDKPEEVGADRMVNSCAAWNIYKHALMIVDFGTATTFDVVNSKGAYVGGVIAPGVNLSLDALHKAAAKLPNVRLLKPDDIVGKSTIKAMQSGMYYGYLSMIEGVVARIKEDMSEDMKVIATGGLAPLYAGDSDFIDEVIPSLTVQGLRDIYNAAMSRSRY